MNLDQRINELRRALAMDERLAQLIRDVSKDYADAALRKQYQFNDAAVLIRLAGNAEGAELFAKEITKSPKVAQSGQSA